MNKRKQAFLDKKTKLIKFTKSSLINVMEFTEDEVQQMIDDKFIVPVSILICEKCFVTKSDDKAECIFCGNDVFYENTNYYEYGIKN